MTVVESGGASIAVATDVINRTGSGPLAIITVSGDVDVMNAGRLREAVMDEYAAGTRHFVLDLSAVSFLDSTGLGVLVATHRRTRNGAGSLRLVVTGKTLVQLLRVTGLDQVFRSFPTLDEALSSASAADTEGQRVALVPPRAPHEAAVGIA